MEEAYVPWAWVLPWPLVVQEPPWARLWPWEDGPASWEQEQGLRGRQVLSPVVSGFLPIQALEPFLLALRAPLALALAPLLPGVPGD